MPYNIRAFIKFDEDGYFAECLEFEVNVSGHTLDETVDNLRSEVCRRLEGADLDEMGLEPDPTLFITLEDVPLIRFDTDCRRCRPS